MTMGACSKSVMAPPVAVAEEFGGWACVQGESTKSTMPGYRYPSHTPGTFLVVPHESTARRADERAPVADLTALTDDELHDLVRGLSGLIDEPMVDFGRVRGLLADWALTARLRSHPDFAGNAEAFRKAIADDPS